MKKIICIVCIVLYSCGMQNSPELINPPDLKELPILEINDDTVLTFDQLTVYLESLENFKLLNEKVARESLISLSSDEKISLLDKLTEYVGDFRSRDLAAYMLGTLASDFNVFASPQYQYTCFSPYKKEIIRSTIFKHTDTSNWTETQIHNLLNDSDWIQKLDLHSYFYKHDIISLEDVIATTSYCIEKQNVRFFVDFFNLIEWDISNVQRTDLLKQAVESFPDAKVKDVSKRLSENPEVISDIVQLMNVDNSLFQNTAIPIPYKQLEWLFTRMPKLKIPEKHLFALCLEGDWMLYRTLAPILIKRQSFQFMKEWALWTGNIDAPEIVNYKHEPGQRNYGSYTLSPLSPASKYLYSGNTYMGFAGHGYERQFTFDSILSTSVYELHNQFFRILKDADIVLASFVYENAMPTQLVLDTETGKQYIASICNDTEYAEKLMREFQAKQDTLLLNSIAEGNYKEVQLLLRLGLFGNLNEAYEFANKKGQTLIAFILEDAIARTVIHEEPAR